MEKYSGQTETMPWDDESQVVDDFVVKPAAYPHGLSVDRA